jgi:hypothetical protein
VLLLQCDKYLGLTALDGYDGNMPTMRPTRRWFQFSLSTLFVTMAAQIVITGCGPNWPVKNRSLSDYKAVMQSARTALPVAVEIEELYLNADHFISHFGFNASPKQWHTVATFGERYELHMVVEVSIDYEKRILKQLGDPAFSVIEYTKIDKLRGGRMRARFPNSTQVHFGAKEWEHLYESRGDSSTVNVKLNPEPVPNFKEFMASGKGDLIPISLLDR